MERKKNITIDDNDASTSKVTDWVKKTVLTGVGAVFMTEEGIRNALSDMKMPKTVIAAAVSQAEKTKKEVSSMIAKEVREFLDRIKVEDIIQKVLAGQSIEIRATIEFADKTGEPKVKMKARKEAGKMTDEEEDD